jgi:hypothetical protein
LEDWVLFGMVLLVVLLLLLLLHYRGATRRGAAPLAEQAEAAPSPGSRWVPDEILVTADLWQGLRVLEYSRPPKGEASAAVYAKCFVPVDAQYVLRVEERVAEARG